MTPTQQSQVSTLASELVANYQDGALSVALAVVEEISKRRVASAIASTLANKTIRSGTPARIVIGVVADYYGLDDDEIYSKHSTRGPQREQDARQAAWFVLRQRLGLSYPTIGHEFGRDHTTVMKVLRRYEKRLPLADIAAINNRLDELQVFAATAHPEAAE